MPANTNAIKDNTSHPILEKYDPNNPKIIAQITP